MLNVFPQSKLPRVVAVSRELNIADVDIKLKKYKFTFKSQTWLHTNAIVVIYPLYVLCIIDVCIV